MTCLTLQAAEDLLAQYIRRDHWGMGAAMAQQLRGPIHRPQGSTDSPYWTPDGGADVLHMQ